MPVVGSSRMSTSGSDNSAMANRSRCCWPPEHLVTLRSPMSAMPARCITESTDAWWTKSDPVSSSVSRTLMSLSSPAVCMTAATRPLAMALRGDWPSTLTVPAVGSDNPRIMSMVVVFPAPLGPRNATISPGRMVRSMPRTACTDPKSFRSPTAEIAGTPPSTPSVRVVAAVDVGVVVMSSSMAARGHS